MGFHFANALIHLIVLSIVAFFHFLLEHRMGDIQDWVFFHGWEVVGLGKIIALIIMARFIGILSIERRPFVYLFRFQRGFFKKDVLMALTIFILGIIIVGDPQHIVGSEFDLYRTFVSFLGHFIFYGSDALVILALNKFLPLKDGQWRYQVVLFSLISFFVQKNVFLFGVGWKAEVIFALIMCFYLIRFENDVAWIHTILAILILFAPLATFFGLDPLWGNKFSTFRFTGEVGGLEVGVFTLLILFFLKRKEGSLKFFNKTM